ncbi:MAG: radical SAM protein [Candidatus Altiarchaeota archaeon]
MVGLSGGSSVLHSIAASRLGLRRRPSFCTFIVSWRCNARCVMCDIWRKKSSSEMDLGQISSVFSKLGRLDALRLTGGEPFLRPDIGQIIDAADSIIRPGMVHITSNGLLTSKIVDTVKSLKRTDNLHVKISLDYPDQRHDRLRGIEGAFDRAHSTLKELSRLREKLGFYLGIDQTIVNPDQLTDGMRTLCDGLGVGLHQVLAYDFCPLYGADGGNITEAYNRYGKKEAAAIIGKMRSAHRIPDFKERMVKRYYLSGLENRILKGVSKPNPECAALGAHIRILPDGDVPVCLYHPAIVGNLLRQGLDEIWFGKEIQTQRKVVRECPGCWAGCEVIPSAIYCGDIFRAII